MSRALGHAVGLQTHTSDIQSSPRWPWSSDFFTSLIDLTSMCLIKNTQECMCLSDAMDSVVGDDSSKRETGNHKAMDNHQIGGYHKAMTHHTLVDYHKLCLSSNGGTPSLQRSNGAPESGFIATRAESAKASSAADYSVPSGASSSYSSQVVSALSSLDLLPNLSSSSNNSISFINSIALASTSSTHYSLRGNNQSSQAAQQSTVLVPGQSHAGTSLASLVSTSGSSAWISLSTSSSDPQRPASSETSPAVSLVQPSASVEQTSSVQPSETWTQSSFSPSASFSHIKSTLPVTSEHTQSSDASARRISTASSKATVPTVSTQRGGQTQASSVSLLSRGTSSLANLTRTSDPTASGQPRESTLSSLQLSQQSASFKPSVSNTTGDPRHSSSTLGPVPITTRDSAPHPEHTSTQPGPKTSPGHPNSKSQPDPTTPAPVTSPVETGPNGSHTDAGPQSSSGPGPDPKPKPPNPAPKESPGPDPDPKPKPTNPDPQPTPKASNTGLPSPSSKPSSECRTETAVSEVVSCSTVATVISSTSGVKETCTTSTSTFRGCSADATTRTTTAPFTYPSVHECSPSRQAKTRRESSAAENASQPDKSIVKRVFPNPQRYPNTSPQAWGAWVNREARKLTTHIVPHGETLNIPLGRSETTSEIHELKDSVLSASIIDLNGCTSIVVASRRGVFLCHIYETPSMKSSLDWTGPWIHYPNGLFRPRVAIQNTFETDVQEALRNGTPDLLRPGNHLPVMYGIDSLTLNYEDTAFLSTDPQFGDNDIKAFIITPRPSHFDPFQGRSVRDPEPPSPARADLADLDPAAADHVQWIKGYLSHKFPQHPVEVIAYDKRVQPPPPANEAIGKMLFQYDPFAEVRPMTVPNPDGSTIQCNTHIAKWRLFVMESQHEYSMNWISHGDQLTDGTMHFPRGEGSRKLPSCPLPRPKGHSTTSKTVTARTQTTAMPQVTSCTMSVVSSHKFTVSIATAPGKYSTSVDSLPETTECACNDGVRAGLSTTTGILGATTWYCAIN